MMFSEVFSYGGGSTLSVCAYPRCAVAEAIVADAFLWQRRSGLSAQYAWLVATVVC